MLRRSPRRWASPLGWCLAAGTILAAPACSPLSDVPPLTWGAAEPQWKPASPRRSEPLRAASDGSRHVERESAASDEEREPVAEVEPVDATLLDTCTERRRIVVFKAERRLELRCGDALAGRYEISLGFAPSLHKEREGDGRTPEGEYLIVHKFVSQYHRSLQLAYPNAADAERGLADGVISARQHAAIVNAASTCREPPQNTMLGSFIQIHGSGGGPDAGDWTLGCVALDNDPIEAVYRFHQRGCRPDGTPRTPVQILP